MTQLFTWKEKKQKITGFILLFAFMMSINSSFVYAESNNQGKPDVELTLADLQEDKKEVTIDVTQELTADALKDLSKDLTFTMNIEDYTISDGKKLLETLEIKSDKGTDYSKDKRVTKKEIKENQFTVTLAKSLVGELVKEENTSVSLKLKEEVTETTSESVTAKVINNVSDEASVFKIELRITTEEGFMKNNPYATLIGEDGMYDKGKPISVDMNDKDLMVIKFLKPRHVFDVGADKIQIGVIRSTGTQWYSYSDNPGWKFNTGLQIAIGDKIDPTYGPVSTSIPLRNIVYRFRGIGEYRGKSVDALIYPTADPTSLRTHNFFMGITSGSSDVGGGSFAIGTRHDYPYPGEYTNEFKMNFVYSGGDRDQDFTPVPPTTIIMPVPLYSAQFGIGTSTRKLDFFTYDEHLENIISNPFIADQDLGTSNERFNEVRSYVQDTNKVGLITNNTSSHADALKFNFVFSNTNTVTFGLRHPAFIYNTELSFFDSRTKMLVLRDIPQPTIDDTINETDTKVRAKIHQKLPTQPTELAYHPIDIKFQLPHIKQEMKRENLKITSLHSGTDYSADPRIKGPTYDKLTKTYTLTLEQEFYSKEVEFTDLELVVEATGDMDTSSTEILQVYDKPTGYFKIPVTAWNVPEGKVESEKVENTINILMQKPTAAAVTGKQIGLGQSTATLDAKTFVKDVKSMLAFDEFEFSFEQERPFDTLETGVVVPIVVTSKSTGVKTTIQTIVDVVYDPLSAITVSDAIELKRLPDSNEVIGTGNVSYVGAAAAKIEVKTNPLLTLENETDKMSKAKLHVYKKDKETALKENELLTTLDATPANKTYDFYLRANQSEFKKVDIYNGVMNITFTLKP